MRGEPTNITARKSRQVSTGRGQNGTKVLGKQRPIESPVHFNLLFYPLFSSGVGINLTKSSVRLLTRWGMCAAPGDPQRPGQKVLGKRPLFHCVINDGPTRGRGSLPSLLEGGVQAADGSRHLQLAISPPSFYPTKANDHHLIATQDSPMQNATYATHNLVLTLRELTDRRGASERTHPQTPFNSKHKPVQLLFHFNERSNLLLITPKEIHLLLHRAWGLNALRICIYLAILPLYPLRCQKKCPDWILCVGRE